MVITKVRNKEGGYDPSRDTQASKVPARFYSSNLGGTYTDVNFIMMT